MINLSLTPERYLKLLLISFSLLTASFKSQNHVWSKNTGGTGDDYAYSVAVDNSGNVYAAGLFSLTADLDPGAGSYTVTSMGEGDIFISKFDANGNLIWARAIGGTGDDYARSLAVDASGNVYVTGVFRNLVDFDPGAGTFNMTGAGSADAFVLKLNSSGNFVFAKMFSGTSWDEPFVIHLDVSGNIYITGSFANTVDFDPGAGTFNMTAVSSSNVFISKLDPSGNFLWAKSFTTSNVGQGLGLTTDASGNVYITGIFGGSGDFDPGASTFNLTSNGLNDVFISKLSSSGNHLWATGFGGPNFDVPRGIAVDNSGNVYTGGYFNGTTDFDPGAGTYTLASGLFDDVFVSKLNSSGSFLWARQMGGSSGDQALALAMDGSGNIYTTGSYDGGGDFDPGSGVVNLTSNGVNDIFLSKLDPAGNFMYAGTVGGSSYDEGLALATDNNGNVYLTGYFDGTADLDPGPGTYTLTSNGGKDIFILRLCNTPATPVNVTNPSNQMICNGNSAIISVTGAGTINWYASSTSTTVIASGSTYTTMPLSAGNYTYYASAKTCTNSTSLAAITITVNPTPTINTATSNTLSCSGQSVMLTASGAVSYTWSNGALGGTVSVSPLVSTTYSVAATDMNGCTASATITQNVTTCTGENKQLLSGNNIRLYPNPTYGELDLGYEIISKDIGIEIYNGLGQLVIQQKVAGRKVDLSRLPAGIYEVRLFEEQRIVGRGLVMKN